MKEMYVTLVVCRNSKNEGWYLVLNLLSSPLPQINKWV